ncbi:MAG: FliH/SctL family protein [Eubacteriales bacterium]|nr:FliH/SctL family protein [Eubacteriales bacterium]
MSNLIKSGFVAFEKENAVVIDANKNKIIEAVDSMNMQDIKNEESVEEALAAALIQDVGLYEDQSDVLTFDSNVFGDLSGASEEERQQVVDDILGNAQKEADEIIANAHEEVEQMRAQMYEEIENLRERSEREGFEQGYAEGSEKSMQESEELKNNLQQQIEENEQRFIEDKRKFLQETEHKMVDLLCELIPKLIGVSIADKYSVLLYIVNSAMQNLENSNRYVIRVSSEDYALIAEHKQDIYGAMNPNVDIEIFEDAKLEALQCQIDTDHGIVDVSLDVQLESLIQTLKMMV